MDRVRGKVAVVTGGAVGIGASACRLLAQEGAMVAVTDVNDAAGMSIVEAIRAQGLSAQFWHLDTTQEDQVSHVFKEISSTFGNINVLVNNAGISGINQPTDQVPETEWDRVFNVNVKGVFFATKHVIQYMRKAGGGSIINLSSIYGLVGAPDFPPYHAAKGAVRLMSKTDALLYAADKIRVNSIHPGFIWTPMVENVADHFTGGKNNFMQTVSPLHPLGHLGEPDDIGYGILYLASDESKFMTGSELVIDGGYTAR